MLVHFKFVLVQTAITIIYRQGRRQRETTGLWPPWIFTNDTANVFLSSTHFVKTALLLPTIVVLCCASWR